MKTATSLDTFVGKRIREVREARGLTQEEFGEQVRAMVGRGWSRQVVWQVERGQPVAAAHLVAVAHVLACTVNDLMATDEPVSLGGEQTVRTDSIISGEDAMPEVEGMARLREAVDALTTVRNAWAVYLQAIDSVRHRVAETPALRERIGAFLYEQGQATAAALDATLDDDQRHAALLARDPHGAVKPSPYLERTGSRALAANASPGMEAARDALDTRPLRPDLWRSHRAKEGER